ncbi:E3 SUMO-protein ligase RanBP2-like isoform X3 [Portunus trituberculatus]|uniref:E3 SUMO-protein ligase RanBP2-like isoform X3 n=1 Tax=Portunus trituberculatus TaxID=210409 RepID=UPI001E1CD07A|nr:E3 SUMO-protein ligase RanBP2-like isoform X3 [Portunus trituberculatus]
MSWGARAAVSGRAAPPHLRHLKASGEETRCARRPSSAIPLPRPHQCDQASKQESERGSKGKSVMLPRSSKRSVEGDEVEERGRSVEECSSGEEEAGRGATSPKRKRFSSGEKARKGYTEDSMEDTKDSNDWGGWGDRYSDHDSGSRDRYSSRSNVKPGDWDCPSCQFSNFASRTACFKCRTPKDGDSFGSGGRMGGGGGGGIRDMRPGDWMCPKCQFHNFSSRGMCYKCNSPRDELAGGGGGGDRYSSPRRPGEWDCPNCQFCNFSHRDYCFKCRSPREEGGRSMGGGGGGGMNGPRSGMRAGDWECQQCQFHNFASRDQCFKCSSPK